MCKSMKNLLCIVLACCMLLLSSCLKKDEAGKTIVLMGQESYVKPIEEVVPNSLLAFLKNPQSMHGRALVLPEGNNPPDIQGEYLFAPRILYAWSHDKPSDGDVMRFRFGGEMSLVDDLPYYPQGQHNRVISCDYQESSFPILHVDTIYLMGHGMDFTAYFEVKYPHVSGIPGVDFDLFRAFVITGSMNSSGDIEKAVCAMINKKVEINENSGFVTEASILSMKGRIYVYKIAGDGKAIRCQWYPY